MLVLLAVRTGSSVATVAGVAFGLFAARLALAWRQAPIGGEPRDLDVAVIVPMYNEDPALLQRCLTSLAAQSYLPSRVWLVDDGSADTSALEVAARFDAPFELRLLRSEVNRGKRRAQAEAIRRDTTAHVFVASDSDCVFDVDAIREGVKAFNDDAVMAAGGMVRPLNRTANVLTRLQDAEYHCSFLTGRAWQSQLGGSVMVSAGGLSFYRADLVREVLDDYLRESFLGRSVTSGDDRMLTQLALQRGKVVMQHSALVETAVPERMHHLLKQRIRWDRSLYVGSVWAFSNFQVASVSFWIRVYQLALVLTTMLCLVFLLAAAPVMGVGSALLLLTAVASFSYVSGARMLTVRLPGQSAWQRLATFAMLGPMAVFSLLVLAPVRFAALFTVHRIGVWGTRQQVEVTV